MKKLLIVMVVALSICACGHKNSSNSKQVDSAATVPVDSAAIKDSIEKADSAAVVAYLEKLYNLVLNQKGDEKELTSNFSSEMKKRLIAANDYDDGSMALWELRTGAQDGPSDVSKVKSITKDKDWYVVKYTDMGWKGSTKLKVTVDNGKIVVTDYKRMASNVSSTIGNVDEVEQALRDFESLTSSIIKEMNSTDDPIRQNQLMSAFGQADNSICSMYYDRMTSSQKKRVKKCENKFL